MDRIAAICSCLERCESFADIGCDHGYCTKYALENGLCRTAVISDISASSLKKAEELLKDYIERGVCRPQVADGLCGIDGDIGQVLIAGMGGTEIIKILSQGFIPKKFVLQPMKDLKNVRAYLLERGCKIIVDDMFYSGRYYFIIKGERSGGGEKYSTEQLFFGRDSLKNPLFKSFAEEEEKKIRSYIAAGTGENPPEKLVNYLEILNKAAKL